MLPELGRVAALIGDPVRSKMLFGLLDGGELSASELAARGDSSPQAASAHLAKLVTGGLLCVRTAGRRRLFRLASPHVAHAMEALAAIAPAAQVTSLNQHTSMERLREARSCYDHLAGRLGVRLTQTLVGDRCIRLRENAFHLTARGEVFFVKLGIDVETLRRERRRFGPACLDWTERTHHVAGALGAALLETFLRNRWVMRNASDRALRISSEGSDQIRRIFGLDLRK